MPHNLSRYGKEMGTVLPVHIGDVDQLEVGFVNQGSCLDGASRPLILHEAPCNAAKFVVNPGGQLLQSALIAARPSAKKSRGFRTFTHKPSLQGLYAIARV